MNASTRIFQRAFANHAVAWLAIAALGVFVASRSHVAIAEWIAPVRAEIPNWTQVGLGIPDPQPLPNYALVVPAEVLRAAQLLQPNGQQLSAPHGHWWFDAKLALDGKEYDVEAQVPSSDHGAGRLRVRFLDRDRPEGAQGLEFTYDDAADQLRHLAANAAAHDAGLLAAPTGLARLRINGSRPQVVRWTETNSTALLQRLGYPDGEIFRFAASDEAEPRPYRATIKRRPSRAEGKALERLLSIIRQEDEATFRREIGEAVDVAHVLAWSALAEFLGDGQNAPSPDWYFDTITGRLVPLVRTFIESPGAPPSSADAHRLVARLLAHPDLRTRRDQLLASWIGTTRSASLEAADRRVGDWAARYAAKDAVLDRASALPELAQLRRSLRHDFLRRAESLRRSLLRPEALHAAVAPKIVGSSILTWVQSTGLPFRVAEGTLTLPAGDYRVETTLQLPATHRLVIEPGTRLAMGPGVSLVTSRSIEAIGTQAQPIEIVALDTGKPWGTIGVVRASGTSRLSHVTVSGGSSDEIDGIEFTGALAFNASAVILRDSDVRDCHGDDAMSIRRTTFQVERSRFINNASDGLDAEWATGSVERSLFANNGDDGLDLATSSVRVHRGWFRGMGDKALSAGERSQVTVTESQLVDSQIAIASKEDSTVAVHGSEIRRNEIGISLYRDNLVFGSGYGTIDGGLFAENLRDFAVEAGSGLTLNGVERRQESAAGVLIGLHDPATAETRSVQ